MLRDSNTGSPDYVPPVAPPVNGGISGPGNPADDTDPPARTVERLNVVYFPYDYNNSIGKQDPNRPTSGANARTSWSSEGQAPVLTGIRVEAWYTDGSMKILNAGALATIPAILGEEYTGEALALTGSANAVAGVTMATGTIVSVAEPKTIYVYSRADGGPTVPVTIPGVRALAFGAGTSPAVTARGSSTPNDGQFTSPIATSSNPNPSPTTHKVFGATRDTIRFSGSLAGEFFEDGEGPTMANLTSVQVEAKYLGLVTSKDNPRTTAVLPTSGWETITLTTGHIFDDYYAGFSNTAPTSSKRFAYGINTEGPNTDTTYPKNTINLLISKGKTHGGASGNTSVYIAVPSSATYHYIRSVEVVSVDWQIARTVGGVSRTDNFYLPGDGILNPAVDTDARREAAMVAWDNALIANNIKLKVYYDDYATSEERDVQFFQRAVVLGRAGVLSLPDLRDPDEESYGVLSIGYYSAILSAARNFPLYGELPNFDEYKLPIAAFVEGSGELKPKPTVPAETLPLKFVNNTRGNISDAQLLIIKNTYDLYGTFSFEGQPIEMVIVPGSSFSITPPNNYFPGTPLRVTEPELVTIEMTVPRGLAYAGEEGSFDVMAYPTGYDGPRDLIP